MTSSFPCSARERLSGRLCLPKPVSSSIFAGAIINHRDTEGRRDAQRRRSFISLLGQQSDKRPDMLLKRLEVRSERRREVVLIRSNESQQFHFHLR